MTTLYPETKSDVRKRLRARLNSLTPPQRLAAAKAVCAQLPQRHLWQNAQTILFYAPLPDELDIWPLLQFAFDQHKLALIPRFNPTSHHYEACALTTLQFDLQPGYFGIREPDPAAACFPLNQLDLVLVPGVAFSVNGHRIGRGKGFYDRLLAQVSGAKCGIAFDEQIEPSLPMEPHDVVMNCIQTPTRWLEIAQPPAL